MTDPTPNNSGPAPEPEKAKSRQGFNRCPTCGSGFFAAGGTEHLKKRKDKACCQFVIQITAQERADLVKFQNTFGYPSRQSAIRFLIRKALYNL